MKSFTDIEQSKKLAEMLPVESADMSINHSLFHNMTTVLTTPYKKLHEFFSGDTPDITLPCWSLAALLGVMPKCEGKDLSLVFGSYDGGYHPLWFCTYEETPMILEICTANNPIDACVEMVYKLKERNLL